MQTQKISVVTKKPNLVQKLSSAYSFAQGLRAFVRVCQNIDRLDEIIAVSNKIAISNPHLIVRLMKHIQDAKGQSAQALIDKPRLGKLRLDDLKKCPEGSLGHGLASYLIKNNLNPEDLPNFSANNPVEYVRAHFFETHDVWHVVTGFETTVDGEMGLQAFGVAQYPIPLNCLNLAAGIINMAFFTPENRLSRMDEIVKGWQMGRKARPLFGVDWKQLWNEPLEKVRADLAINTL